MSPDHITCAPLCSSEWSDGAPLDGPILTKIALEKTMSPDHITCAPLWCSEWLDDAPPDGPILTNIVLEKNDESRSRHLHTLV